MIIMVRKLHIKESVNKMEDKVYDNVALLGYACALAANDLHHIHLCAEGDKFQEIHETADQYLSDVRNLNDFCLELAKEGGLSLYNETYSLDVIKDSGNDWKVAEKDSYNFVEAFTEMSNIFTDLSQFIMIIQQMDGVTSDVASEFDNYLRNFTKAVNYFIEKKLANDEDILTSQNESVRRSSRRRTVSEANKGYSAKVYQILDDTYVSEWDNKVDSDFIADNVDLFIFNDRDQYFNGVKNTRRKVSSVAYDGLLGLFQTNVNDADGKVRVTSEMAKQWLKKHNIDYIQLLKPVVTHIEQYRKELEEE